MEKTAGGPYDTAKVAKLMGKTAGCQYDTPKVVILKGRKQPEANMTRQSHKNHHPAHQ
jgi:hypothetical protein